MDKANSYVVPNAYPQLIEENGGVGMNAGTGEDSTNYFYNFPRNRLELWFLLESQRFYDPVFREFYKERDVVREERRMRVESSPQGMLVEALLATAFAAHPYRNMPGGWASDIENFRLPEAIAFYKKYYVPSNITIGIAGDVDPKECRRLADKYFSILPAGPDALWSADSGAGAERGKARPGGIARAAVHGHRLQAARSKRQGRSRFSTYWARSCRASEPACSTPNWFATRRSRWARSPQPSFPGGKYPNLFLFFLVPNRGHSVEENEKACYQIIEHLKTDKVDDETLNRIKIKMRAALIRRLDSNSGMAEALTSYYANYGDWRKLFTSIDDIDKVTADDVQRVAKQYLIPETRTVAYTVRSGSAARKSAGRRRPMRLRYLASCVLIAGLGERADRGAPRGGACLLTRI